MNTQQKRVLAIHDISCVGRCSLTVALPVISAGGIETSVLPTAVLSTHTGGFQGFTYHDLTSDIMPICHHWKSLGLQFDAIYTGFLGSFEQIDLVMKIFDMFGQNALKIVDPVMADNGKLYSVFDKNFPKGMKQLCEKADIIVPNITEACYMLDISYCEGPYSREYIKTIIDGLLHFCKSKIVLTGVSFEPDKLGVAAIEAPKKEIKYYFNKKVPGIYHGSGDVFASALVTAILRERSLIDSSKIAADFTVGSIRRTFDAKTDVRFGIDFEEQIPQFIADLESVSRV